MTNLKPMDRISNLTVPALLALILSACSTSPKVTVKGTIDYTGSSNIFIEKQPLHYKYADKIRYPVSTGTDGAFQISLPADSTKVAFFTIDDETYPLVIQPGNTLSITVRREFYPDSVTVTGYPQPWNAAFKAYRKADKPIQEHINEELPAFKEGKQTDIISLYKQRYKTAGRLLLHSPLDMYYYKAIGDYLFKRLEYINYAKNTTGINPEKERKDVLKEATELGFFSFRSLKAQRAGIRDFTNAYANTFGVEDSLEKKYGQQLTQYDVKRLGYERMNQARVSVLKHIKGRRALAYAKMYLIAERIGEMSPETAEKSYNSYLKEFSDYPSYTGFLKQFYTEVKSVSPGQPAIPFSLPDANGKTVQLKDFRGKYVLLDFWAAWCIPCLDEFPYMKSLYKTYSGDDFEIVAISLEEDSLTWRKAINRFKNPWPQLYGGKGFQQETFAAYRGGGIPFYILVDPQGNILRYNDIRPSFNLPAVLDSLINK